MSTENQIAANILNSQNSTGPRTEEGKKTSSMNGQTHGLTGAVALMSSEDENAFDTHFAEHFETWQPANFMERELAHLIAGNAWLLKRALRQSMIATLHPHQSPEEAKQIQLRGIYSQRIRRAMQQDIARLQTIQAERKAERAKAFEEAVLFARLAHIEGHAYDVANDFTAENGFGISNDEIIASIRRADRMNAARFYERTNWDRERKHKNYRPGVIELPKAA